MRYLMMMSALLCLSGCGQDERVTNDGGSTPDAPQVIIETGYLRCAPATDECDGALTCTTEADESVCVEAEAEECVGEASCACEGAWVCGDRSCVDVEGGFECDTPPDTSDVCMPADCGEPISGGLCDDGQPYEITCERNDAGSCEWVVDECQEPPAACEVADCGEPISGGLCDDGQPYEVTCERNDAGSCEWVVGECQEPPAQEPPAVCEVADCGEPISGGLCDDGQSYEVTCERNDAGSCEWVVGECQEPPAACEVADCGEPISGGLCDDGQPYEVTCERNDAGSCEWVVGECVNRSVDRQLTVFSCPPIEVPNDPYEIRSVELEGDLLYVGVEYGGGCGEHEFGTCPSNFQGTTPMQIVVGLSHDSGGDTCEALMSELIAIDLTWIKEQHQAQFSGADREVNVILQGPNGEESVLYSY